MGSMPAKYKLGIQGNTLKINENYAFDAFIARNRIVTSSVFYMSSYSTLS